MINIIAKMSCGLSGSISALGAYWLLIRSLYYKFQGSTNYYIGAVIVILVGFIFGYVFAPQERVKRIIENIKKLWTSHNKKEFEKLKEQHKKVESAYQSLKEYIEDYKNRMRFRPGLLTWAGYESAFKVNDDYSVQLVEYILGLGKLDVRAIYANGRKVLVSIIDDELLKQPRGPYSRNLLVFSLTNDPNTTGENFWQGKLGISLQNQLNIRKIELVSKDLIYFAREESTRFLRYFLGLPVRWGVNAIVFDKQLRSTIDNNIFNKAKDLWEKRKFLKIGIFDWQLLNLSLFSKYIYSGSNQDVVPSLEKGNNYTIGMKELQNKIKLLCEEKNCGIVYRFKTPEDTIKAFSREEINVLIGGGFWSTNFSQRDIYQNIIWKIPEEGGTIWMESVVIFEDAREDTVNLNKAIELVNRLFQQEVQVGLANPNELFCRGYPTKVEALKELCIKHPDYDEEIKKIFDIKDVNDLTHTTRPIPSLEKRKYPSLKVEESWDEIWENIILKHVDLYQ